MINLYEKLWSSREYLTQYYTTEGVAEDEYHIFKFIINFFKKRKLKFSDILEVGCGPTIHHMLPFVPHVKNIFMADYLNSNLAEIKKWIKGSPKAHNWNPYIIGELRLEGSGSKLTLKKRVHDFRAEINDLLPCDVHKKCPIGIKKTFPLVTSFYCLECVNTSKKKWLESMRNLSSLVAKGGWVIMSTLRDTEEYLVCGKKFSVVRINEHDMRSSLIDNGFIPNTIKIEIHKIKMWELEGFSSIIICSAQKA